MKTALTIAGSDSSGGAGIQADLKTMLANGVYGMSAITALTAQNTTGVQGIYPIDIDFIEKQLDSIFTDIYPDAVKTGMLSSKEIILAVSKKLKEYGAKNIVVDPVMVATSGDRLINEDTIKSFMDHLFPLASVITPNIKEAEILAAREIKNEEDMVMASRLIGEKASCSVLLKGGHSKENADDVLYQDGEIFFFRAERIENPNCHGTGCTLSSAIASNLAKGLGLREAIQEAKAYISGALKDMMDLGKGSGPLNHGYKLR